MPEEGKLYLDRQRNPPKTEVQRKGTSMIKEGIRMKIILLLAVLGAILITGSLVLAEKPFMVKCCIKGDCRTTTRPECQRSGYIVTDCGQCK